MSFNLGHIQSYYEKTRWDYRWAWGVRNTYALHYGFYDEKATHHKAAVANMNKVMAEQVDIEARDQVLDAGCGVGGSGIWLAKNIACHVTGITPVTSQIEDAKANAEKAGVASKTAFIQADFLNTPFPDASFDVIWALESVCHAIQKIEFYQEAFRLLKPGGRLIMAEYCRQGRPFAEAEEQLLQNWLHRWMIDDIDTPEEHRLNAQAAGFKNFDTQDITSHTLQSSKNIHEHGEKWLWAASALNKVGIVSTIQLENVRGSIHQYEALKEELWRYQLICAGK